MKDYLLFFAGSSHPQLANEISIDLGIPVGAQHLSTFPDGEISLEILENVRDKNVYILQSLARQPNFYLMELLVMIDALKRASARTIVPVIPYFAYSRQDRKDKPQAPITAKLVADLLEKAGATNLLTADLHTGQIQGFFNIPVENMHARLPLAKAVREDGLKDFVVIAPDLGAIKMARAFARELKCEFCVVDKRRSGETGLEGSLIGDVKGKDVVLIDDMCTTGATLVQGAKLCKAAGAKRVLAATTHGLFVGNALKTLDDSPIETLYVTDSVPCLKEYDDCKNVKIKKVSIAKLLAEGIKCVEFAKPLTSVSPE